MHVLMKFLGLCPGLLALGLVSVVPLASASKAGAPLSEYQPKISEEFASILRGSDPAAGEDYFMRKCSSCHDHLREGGHGKGPHLWNIFGRQAGTQADFEYSEAMQASGHTWGFATLNYYLTRTDRAVPGLSMNFRGIRNDAQRAELLRFLATLNDTEPDLPGVVVE